jgi:anti-anti-sigma factor
MAMKYLTTPNNSVSSPALHIARVPGELGPIVRCSGELTLATREALRRELHLLTSLRPVALVLNVADCRTLDADGLLFILEVYKRLRTAGGRLAVVAGSVGVGSIIRNLGIDCLLPVFLTEDAAVTALRGGGPPDAAPASWQAARSESLARWRGVLAALEEAPADDLLIGITSSHGLCRRAEEVARMTGAKADDRCSLCPLFHALGARPEDLGCQSVTQPMVDSLLAGDRSAARAQMAQLIALIETIPLPQG